MCSAASVCGLDSKLTNAPTIPLHASAADDPLLRSAMQRAIDLARRGWGRVSPNPLVGAVVVQDRVVVGDGWHAEFGGEHAEVVALRKAGWRARGSTLVVTLEPCAHHGKTPPCVDAIREALVGRVVVAIRDPDQSAKGGAEILRATGIVVETGVMAEAAASLIAPFLFVREQQRRPFLALKLATSIDGRIADAVGRSQWISGQQAQSWAHWLRAGFDAIAVGAETARRDDPMLTVRGGITPRRPPVRVVFDRRASLPLESKLAVTAKETPTWVIASEEAPDVSVKALEQLGVRVFRPLSLSQGLAMLREAGIESVLCEGGGALGVGLMAEGLVDRLYWLQAPVWLGSGGVPAFPGVADTVLDEAPRWVPVERRPLGADTLLVLDRRLCLPAS
jgi:diaminohydroxyphosphoribosylaminopyrimidine deaminase / 5-amino-6-(5-phosphoribosylamino)uracil reductase